MPVKTTTVTNTASLMLTLKTAGAGDTILLASGNYGAVAISGFQPTGTVTIKSANPNADAVFTTLRLTNVANLVINDVDVSRPLTSSIGLNTAAVNVSGSRNVSFVGVDFAGSLNGNSSDDGHGISIVNSNRISVLDSTFRQLDGAIIVSRTDNIIVAGNTITETREGASISQVRGGLFDRNHITNMQPDYAAGDHPDMFQVHTGGKLYGASSDLKFSNNVMIQGTSGPVGGIFISSQNDTVKFSNITVENNYYEGAYRHAISVYNTKNVVIDNNTVLMGNNAGVVPAINIADVTGAKITNNVATLILEHRIFLSTGVSYANNIDVWDPQFKKGVAIADLFAAPSGGAIDFDRLNVLGSSAAAASGAGFHNVAGIGNLAGSASAQLAAYLPQFDSHFTALA